MRSSEAYWHVDTVVNEIGQLVEQAWTLIKADNGRQALTILEANAIQIRGRGRQKGDFLIKRRKQPISRQKGTNLMTSRILQEMTADKRCQQTALPVLEEIYPRELVCQVLHDLHRWEQRERKLNHVLMV